MTPHSLPRLPSIDDTATATGGRVPPPGTHGGDGPAIAAALGIDPREVVDLSQTLNPYGPDVAGLCRERLEAAIGRYPDPAVGTAALAEALRCDRSQVLLTNGGSEAIALVAAVVGGAVAVEPEFGLHPRRGGGQDGSDGTGGGPWWRSNPNNPTGRLAHAGEQAGVWDEAFYPLTTGRWTRGDAAGGAVVVGSLTKVFACPGLRLGYVLAGPDVVESCRRRQPLWSVNSLALAVLPDLLERADLASWARRLAQARAATVEVLSAHGLVAEHGDAPWVLCHAPGLRDALARRGVVVRDCASFGLPGVVRLAAGDDQARHRLDRALAAGWPA